MTERKFALEVGMSADREYWDLELKNQSKERMALVNAALEKFGGIVHDRHENRYFPSQPWRNPLAMRISLPKGKKYEFILAIKVKAWLHEPPRVGIFFKPKEAIALKGDHDKLRFVHVRNYRIHPGDRAYVKDCRTGVVLEGAESVKRILDGELDLILGDR